MIVIIYLESILYHPTETVSRVVGGHTVEGYCPGLIDCFEANTDVQYLMAVSQDVPTTYWYSTVETIFIQRNST
jgi:hypothetical protein